MKVVTRSFAIKTRGHTDILDITSQISQALESSELKHGILTCFIGGSTAGITTIEYEGGLKRDLPEIWEKLVPSNRTYHHDATWGDANGYAHLRSSLVGTSFTVPFVGGRMILGTWQQIVFLDFDNRPRNREVTVQIMGE
jgi:secondary thiamine-phosphate synthase enzyme